MKGELNDEPESVPPFAEEWREEIRRRIAQIESGEVTLMTWEEVRRKAREMAREKALD